MLLLMTFNMSQSRSPIETCFRQQLQISTFFFRCVIQGSTYVDILTIPTPKTGLSSTEL